MMKSNERLSLTQTGHASRPYMRTGKHFTEIIYLFIYLFRPRCSCRRISNRSRTVCSGYIYDSTSIRRSFDGRSTAVRRTFD